MARITVEDCLKNVDNRFTLIHMAAKRVRQLRKGAEQTIVSKNKDIVVSLREIAASKVVKAEKREENHIVESEDALLPKTSEEEIEQKTLDKEEKKEDQVTEGD